MQKDYYWQIHSKSELLYDWRFTANHFVLAPSPLIPNDQYFFQMSAYGYSPYITFPLTGGWVCRLQLLLALATAVILRSPAGLMTIFYCLRFKTPPNVEGQVPVCISPRNRVAQL
jgi:hypothetical protein